MHALFNLVDTLISLYIWALILAAALSWFIALNIVNVRHRGVIMVGQFLDRITEPALRPIRRILPHLGGIDVSPVVLILGLMFLRDLMAEMGLTGHGYYRRAAWDGLTVVAQTAADCLGMGWLGA